MEKARGERRNLEPQAVHETTIGVYRLWYFTDFGYDQLHTVDMVFILACGSSWTMMYLYASLVCGQFRPGNHWKTCLFRKEFQMIIHGNYLTRHGTHGSSGWTRIQKLTLYNMMYSHFHWNDLPLIYYQQHSVEASDYPGALEPELAGVQEDSDSIIG